MAAIVFKIAPVSRSDIKAVKRHWQRIDVKNWSPEKDGKVDPELTPYNFVLLGSGNVEKDILNDIDGLSMSCNSRNSKRDKIAGEGIITFGKPAFGLQPGKKLTKNDCIRLRSDAEFQLWLKTTKAWLEKHGCIAAVLHLDEETPHIHCIFSVRSERKRIQKPGKRTRSKKSNVVLNYTEHFGLPPYIGKLARASKENRLIMEKKPEYREAMKKCGMGEHYDSTLTPLGKFQTSLWEGIGKDFGFSRGEAASITGIKGKTTKQWRIEQANKKLDAEINKIEEENAKKVSEIKKNNEDQVKNIKAKSLSNIAEFKNSCDELSKAIGNPIDNITAIVDIVKHIQKSTERFAAKHNLNIDSFSKKMQAALAKAEKARSEEKKIRSAGDDELAAMSAGIASAFGQSPAASEESRRPAPSLAAEAEAEAAARPEPYIDVAEAEAEAKAEGFERWRERRKKSEIYKNMNDQIIHHHNM